MILPPLAFVLLALQACTAFGALPGVGDCASSATSATQLWNCAKAAAGAKSGLEVKAAAKTASQGVLASSTASPRSGRFAHFSCIFGQPTDLFLHQCRRHVSLRHPAMLSMYARGCCGFHELGCWRTITFASDDRSCLRPRSFHATTRYRTGRKLLHCIRGPEKLVLFTDQAGGARRNSRQDGQGGSRAAHHWQPQTDDSSAGEEGNEVLHIHRRWDAGPLSMQHTRLPLFHEPRAIEHSPVLTFFVLPLPGFRKSAHVYKLLHPQHLLVLPLEHSRVACRGHVLQLMHIC